MTSLVMDGDNRGSLAIVRSLGRHGIPAYVAWNEPASLAGYSRYCTKKLVCPPPQVSSQQFLEWLCKILDAMPDAVIYTGSDVTTSIVCKYRLCLQSTTRYALPPQESVDIALNKAATLNLAQQLGVPTPASVCLSNSDSFTKAIVDLGYPAVVKAAQSDLCSRAPTAYAHDAVDLRNILRRAMKGSNMMLVQELIPGEGTGIFALCNHGEPIVTFAHRRRCEHPPWGGVSVISEAIDEPEDTLEYALRILRKLKWHGVAMVEFKRRADGTACLMEINPRFWGSLELAIKAGIDFPYLYHRLAMGEDVKPLPGRKRAINRWLIGEMDSLITGLRNGSRPDGQPHSRLRLIFSHMAGLIHGPCLEVERLTDLRPALYEHNKWLCESVRAALGLGAKGGRR